ITEGLEATIPPGASDTLTVEISAGAAGTFDGTVSFANNDDDENPFDFSITATITLPSIQLTPAALDFGLQEPGRGPTFAMDVTISNTGGAPLNFTGNQVELTGTDAAEFTIVSDTGESTLLFGSSRTVGIVFDPSTIGVKSAELTVTSDDPAGSSAGVPLTGTGIEEQIVVSPLSLDFGEHDLDDGPAAGMDVAIANNATFPLIFTGNEIEVTGVNADQFTVLADTGESILSPGAVRTVTLGFDPSSLGTKSGVLTITSDDANDAIVSVTFTGTGIDQEVDVDSSSLAFGSQAIGEGPTASMQVTVANIGTNTLAFTGTQIELTGSDAAAFTISSDSAEPSLAPGLSRVIMLAFDPSSEGEKEALLVIHTDDTTELTVGVELSGTGTDQEIDVTPLSVGFGTNDVRQGASSDITVTIVNIGTHDLTMTGNEVELTGADATEFLVTSDTGEKVLAPGVERIVKVAFDPVTVGSKNANLTITSDDLDEPVVTVLFTAGGVEQDLRVTGGPLDFGGRDVDEGVTDPLSVTISNEGENSISFTDTAIGITGASAADFDFATPPDTSPLASGEERVLSVVFTPSSLGSKSGTLVTVSTDAGVASIALLGEGTDQEITASPLSVDFGIAKIVTGEGASPEAVTIRNVGRSVFRIDETSFEFLGDNPGDFLIANASELADVNRGEELELSLIFIPTDTGPRSAVLRISTGQSDRPSIDVQLSGIGAVSTGAGFSWALYE
ncbi:choice-of-anchor D domain-containing protein, partial [Candidatus Sumerlaeota bacterium]|nr:choice-of-anchor D domain-containing protein [Candidatus Sumerlaeota bacterium]